MQSTTTTPLSSLSLAVALPYDILVIIMANCPLTTMLALRASCQVFNDIYTSHRTHLGLITRPSAPLRVLAAAKALIHTHISSEELVQDPCNRFYFSCPEEIFIGQPNETIKQLLRDLTRTPLTLTTPLAAADAAYLLAVRSRIAATNTPTAAYRAAWNWQLMNLLTPRELRDTLTVYELWEVFCLYATRPCWQRRRGLAPYLLPVDGEADVLYEWQMKVREIVPNGVGMSLSDAVHVVRQVVRDMWRRMGSGWRVLPEVMASAGLSPAEALAAGPNERERMRKMQVKLRIGVPVARRVVPESGLAEVFERVLAFVDKALAIGKSSHQLMGLDHV